MIDEPDIIDAVRRALEEDIGSGDVTTQACVAEDRPATGRFLAREPQIVAGVELLPLIYRMRGGIEELQIERASGAPAGAGEVVAFVRGAPACCSNASGYP